MPIGADAAVAGVPVPGVPVSGLSARSASGVTAPVVAAPAVRGPGAKPVEPDADVLVAAGVAPQAAPVSAAFQPAAVEPPVAVVAVDAVARIQKMSETEVLVQAAEAVADTILVSPGLLRGQGEVRIQLRPDVLDGTEIRIAVSGRQMDVEFAPRTQDMAAVIERCRPQLEQHLAGRIHSFQIAVVVQRRLKPGERA